jgi:GNAT superfamily N-acetyltransferase
LSEYYRIRRGQITDLTGLIFFIIGWLGAAPFAWPHIKRGFETGSPTTGIFYFALWAFGSGIALGLFGMLAGFVGGRVWEATHRGRRQRIAEIRPATVPAATRATPVHTAKVSAALPPLRWETGEIGIDPYLALVQQFGGVPFDRAHASAALQRSLNVTAWSGDKLVGIARVVTDGYFFAALAEIFVDPSLQRRGLGRDLLNRAFERTPRGVLSIGAPFGNSAFFDAIGCERGVTGFTMLRRAKTEPASQAPS